MNLAAGELGPARDRFQQALELSELLDNPRLRASALRFLGLTHRALRPVMGTGFAIAATSVLFAIPHLEPWRVLVTWLVEALRGFGVAADSGTKRSLSTRDGQSSRWT